MGLGALEICREATIDVFLFCYHLKYLNFKFEYMRFFKS
jgi:hypothetical protein